MVICAICVWLGINAIAFICILAEVIILKLPVLNPLDDIRDALYYSGGLDIAFAIECIFIFPALYLIYIIFNMLGKI